MEKAYRIKKNSDFQTIYKKGKSVANRQFVVYTYNNKENKHFGKLSLDQDEENKLVLSCYKLVQSNMTLCARYLNTAQPWEMENYYKYVRYNKENHDEKVDIYRNKYFTLK